MMLRMSRCFIHATSDTVAQARISRCVSMARRTEKQQWRRRVILPPRW